MSCLHCTAETSNGLALCETCRAAASVYLEFFPVYFRNLARWRPGHAGSRPVPGSREPHGPALVAADKIMRALDEAGAVLTDWAYQLTRERGLEPPRADGEVEQVAALCRWFSEHLTTIATLEWAGLFMADDIGGLGWHESKLRRLTEQVIPGWYSGACHLCATDTYVVPGLTWVTCPGCGATTYARDHLETILDEARTWTAQPMRISEAIVALIDTELSVPRLYERIKKWDQRGKVTGVRRIDRDGDETGPKRYLFGEVLDRLATEGETRLTVVVVRAS